MVKNELHILLVDDNLDHVKILLWALEQSEVRSKVTVVHDGREALELLSQAGSEGGKHRLRPDLIFLDINLPEVNGIDVLRKLKSETVSSEVPIVMLSSSDRAEDISSAYANGANTYISKARVFNEVAQAINTVCVYWGTIALLPTRSN
jgi:two-component system, response regulator